MQAERQPTISVIVPTRNRNDLLSQCLERLSPESQTAPAELYEVIVTDDGDGHAPPEILAEFPWVKWVAGPRRGPAANRNNGAKNAAGQWLAFVDDDCLPDAAWLSSFASAIHPDCDVYEGKTTCASGIDSPLKHAPVNLQGGCLWSCNFLIAKQLFFKVGGFDEEYPYPYMEDADLRDQLVRAGNHYEFVPEAIVDHPPRPTTPGGRLAKYHESWLYHWYKNGHRKLGAPRLILLIFRTRLANALQYPLSLDTLRAFASLTSELWGLLLRTPGWEWKYRRRFLSSSSDF
ncbi:MAG: family 2 glycosyl transferase [Pirellula sp.]|nr:family 2 glycosyl transferase [Pirellula sp.]